jgi:hypothetical protein
MSSSRRMSPALDLPRDKQLAIARENLRATRPEKNVVRGGFDARILINRLLNTSDIGKTLRQAQRPSPGH